MGHPALLSFFVFAQRWKWDIIGTDPIFVIDSEEIVCYFVVMPRSSRIVIEKKLGTKKLGTVTY